ncbi:MAG: hypothetical protein ACOYOK_03225 [Pseudobdellovibrionaceae bacterium]
MQKIFLICLFIVSCGPVSFKSPERTQETAPSTSDTGGTVTPAIQTRDVVYNGSVTATTNKVDIVLVIDDSSSMLADNQKLAARLSNFIADLQSSGFDWQMCVTNTRDNLTGSGIKKWGGSFSWQNYSATPQYLLKPGPSNLSQIFTSTINYIGAGWADSNDERGIKAAWWHLYNGDPNYANASGCYRKEAALAYIIISDEDERSVAGDASQAFSTAEVLPLENEDLPLTLINAVKDIFGTAKRFTVNSIIVKPGDTACKAAQDAESSKSHYGTKYAELASLTGGATGSICDTDYSNNLNLFKESIQNSLSSINLECEPVAPIQVTITPSSGVIDSTVNGMSLSFSPAIPAGRNLQVKYKCKL